jgi:hypothetical protein
MKVHVCFGSEADFELQTGMSGLCQERTSTAIQKSFTKVGAVIAGAKLG